MSEPLDRVIYVAGIHCSGKSTLVRDLVEKKKGFVAHERKHRVELDDTFQRLIWRVTKYWIEAQEQAALVGESPGQIVLGNRCVYDNFGYAKGFLKLGWVSEEDLVQHNDVFKATFKMGELRPRNVVHVNPPIGWVRENLERRWAETGKRKWRESDFEYLEAALGGCREVYSQLGGGVRVLDLTETDREKRVELVNGWVTKIARQLFD